LPVSACPEHGDGVVGVDEKRLAALGRIGAVAEVDDEISNFLGSCELTARRKTRSEFGACFETLAPSDSIPQA